MCSDYLFNSDVTVRSDCLFCNLLMIDFNATQKQHFMLKIFFNIMAWRDHEYFFTVR
jgi:hypothetical protein